MKPLGAIDIDVNTSGIYLIILQPTDFRILLIWVLHKHVRPHQTAVASF